MLAPYRRDASICTPTEAAWCVRCEASKQDCPVPILPECKNIASYRVNWRWGMAMYLLYAMIEEVLGDAVIGSVEYDARSCSGNLRVLEPTEDKLAPLVQRISP